MSEMMYKKFPSMDKDFIKNTVRETVINTMKTSPKTAFIDGREMPLMHIDKYVLNNEYIVTGSGSLYEVHSKSENILSDMTIHLAKTRSVYKKQKFEAMTKGLLDQVQLFDIFQLTIKLLNNAFYGTLTQPNSIFYNPLSGPAITESGRDIITTAVNIFEKFLGNSIFFRNVEDAILYCENIVSEEYSTSVFYKQDISTDRLHSYLLDKVDEYDDSDREYLLNYLELIDEKDLTKIFYKNNIILFLENSDIINKFDSVLGRLDFLDPNKPPKDMVEDLDSVWDIMRDHVFYNYQDYYRYRNMFEDEGHERKRRSVLVVDTDKPLSLYAVTHR